MENPGEMHEAVVTRRFPHPVARVFRAWSEPRHLEGWLRPNVECALRVARFDFREGGEFYFRYDWKGAASPVQGRFLRIVVEQALIFSWSPQPPDPYAGRETMVSVWFRPAADDSTEVELRHTLFPDQIMRGRHHVGWGSAFDLLSGHLSSQA